MKIAIIGPGVMPIPPKGWGAVESLIWDYGTELKNRNHKVIIVNTPNYQSIIKSVNEFEPDFVHLQYDNFADVLSHIKCDKKAATSHFGYIEQYNKHPEYNNILKKFIEGDFKIFCLSEGIKNTYINLGVNPNRLFITPNGARKDLFSFEENIENIKDFSIYLAKIDYRKRQYLFQSIPNLHFAGNCDDKRFDINNENYLGEWCKDFLYKNLTNYSNLVLLSDGEADPLVTKEAMMAGLGLVISEFATANLDLSLPFIDVISEKYINDLDYIKNIIKLNRDKSKKYRNDIRKYALNNFTWDVLVEKYINLIKNI